MNKSSAIKFSADPIPQFKVVKNYGRNWYEMEDKDFYKEIEKLYKHSICNSSFLNDKIRRVIGTNLIGITDRDTALIDQYDMTNLFKKMTIDSLILGGFALEITWNVLHTKIIKTKFIDITRVRVGYYDENYKSRFYYYKDNWLNTSEEITIYQAFSEEPTDNDIQLLYYIDDYKTIYPYAQYFSGLDWVYTDVALGKYYSNLVQNNFVTNCVMSFPGMNFEEPEKQIEFEKSIKRSFTGVDGNGIFVTYPETVEYAPTIESINKESDDQKYADLLDKTVQYLIITHNIPSPLLAGVKTPGQLGGTEELQLSENIYNTNTILPKRNALLETIDTLNYYMVNGSFEYEVKNVNIFDESVLSGDKITEIINVISNEKLTLEVKKGILKTFYGLDDDTINGLGLDPQNNIA